MAHIVFTLEDGTEIETELDSDVITIGRHSDSIVELPSSSVSSHHATIKRRKDSFYVQDLGTTNGTKLNGVEVEEAKLEDGDQLCFGDIPAVVHLTAPQDKKAVLPPVALAKRETGEVDVDELPQRGGARKVPAKKGGAVAGRRPMPMKRGSIPQYKETVGCAGFVAFLSFLALTFIIGLHLRHASETGGFLAGDILKKLRDGVGEQGAAPNIDDKAPAKKKKAKDEPKPAEGAAPATPPVPAPAATPAPSPAAPAMMDGKMEAK